MLKAIESQSRLHELCRTIGVSYLGLFMEDVINSRDRWENRNKKAEYINEMFLAHPDFDNKKGSTVIRINAMIRIIENHKVEDALSYVLATDISKLKSAEAHTKAKLLLEKIYNKELIY